MPRISINPKISVSVVFVAAMFMNIMDITIVNVALPAIGRQFHESTAALDSVAVGYLVSLAVFIHPAGWLGDRINQPKRVAQIESIMESKSESSYNSLWFTTDATQTYRAGTLLLVRTEMTGAATIKPRAGHKKERPR